MLQSLNALSGNTYPPDVAILFHLYIYVEFFCKTMTATVRLELLKTKRYDGIFRNGR